MRRILAISVLALLLPGCASDARRIVGSWQCAGMAVPPGSKLGEIRFRFVSDGTYLFQAMPKQIIPNVTTLVQSSGTYKVEAGKLYLTGQGLPPGFETWKLAGVTDTDLFLQTAAGDVTVYNYKRIGP